MRAAHAPDGVVRWVLPDDRLGQLERPLRVFFCCRHSPEVVHRIAICRQLGHLIKSDDLTLLSIHDRD